MGFIHLLICRKYFIYIEVLLLSYCKANVSQTDNGAYIIPIPPLDGSKVVAMFLPDRWYYRWMQLERYGMFILMVALWFGVFDGFLGTARRVLVDWMLQGANGMFQAVLSLLV